MLPPIDPKARARRGSDNYDPRLMPPRPEARRENSKSSRNSSGDKVSSREKLQKAGQQVLNNGEVNYRIPY